MAVSMWALWARFFTNDTLPGWTSVVVPTYLLGGIQIFCLGMLGEYVGKLYSEVKSRPRYFIEKVVSFNTTRSSTVNYSRKDASARDIQGTDVYGGS